MENKHFRPEAEHDKRLGKKQCITGRREYVWIGGEEEKMEDEPQDERRRTLKVRVKNWRYGSGGGGTFEGAGAKGRSKRAIMF